jgi:hypothetical protein
MHTYMRFLLLVLPFIFTPAAHAAEHPTPMVDGDCSEYGQLPAKRVSVGSGIDMYIYEDDHYVWMCYTYPPGSLGTLDMKLKTDALADTLNLHASAQLGEWPVNRDDLRPKSPESDLWWNNKGWVGNATSLNGMDTSGPAPRYRWKHGTARELQLAKKRFGHGDWQFAMTIYRIKDQSGKTQDVNFPADGSFYTLKTR